MKYFLISILFFVLPISTIAQVGGEDEVYLSGDVINPKFKGGDLDNFYKFIGENFDYSKLTKKGKMVVAFTINENGELKNCKVLQFLDIDSATEILRVLKLSPKWTSAKKGGKSISVELKLPLDFK